MSKIQTIICDLCGQEFTRHDKYTNCQAVLTYTQYLQDDGSCETKREIDICSKCICSNQHLAEIFRKKI